MPLQLSLVLKADSLPRCSHAAFDLHSGGLDAGENTNYRLGFIDHLASFSCVT